MTDGVRSLGVADIRLTELGIMDAIDAFCEERGLRYYLFYGSLLGAVRHEGFIPWDDDMDIIMPRESYQVFLEEFGTERYKVAKQGALERYPYAYAKVYDTSTRLVENAHSKCVYGVFVDVFPMDDLGSDWNEIVALKERIKPKNKMLVARSITWSKQYSFASNLMHMCAHIISCTKSTPRRAQELDELAQSLAQPDSRFAGNLLLGTLRAFPKEWFEPAERLPFEGREYVTPCNRAQLLESLYGDWRTLPPDEKRVTRHCFTAWRPGALQ